MSNNAATGPLHTPNAKERKTMKKTLLAMTVAAMLAGCGGPPKVVMPSGSDRTPVNSEARIEDYKARNAEEQAAYRERSALARQVESMKAELAALKSYLVLQSMEAATNRPKAMPVPQPAQGRAPVAAPATSPAPAMLQVSTAKPVARNETESVEVRGQAVVFRVSHPFAKTDFKPSDAMQEELLKAARSGKRVEIRGRTDAEFDNPIDRDIAMLRALKARRFLVSNGVPLSKIHMSYLASGGFAVDNSTPEGKSINRRVEIEAMDLDTSAFATASAAMTVGSTQ
ncbi:OmpA family protein [Variovorax guangxiensis]|nr:OmpA family protein [Variovorax guangxiensis]